jgi:hypothetical protein
MNENTKPAVGLVQVGWRWKSTVSDEWKTIYSMEKPDLGYTQEYADKIRWEPIYGYECDQENLVENECEEDLYPFDILFASLNIFEAIKYKSDNEFVLVNIGHMRNLLELGKHASSHNAISNLSDLISTHSDKSARDNIEIAVGFYKQCYKSIIQFERDIDWESWVRSLAMGMEDAGKSDDAIQLNLLVAHLKSVDKKIINAAKALKPFAKAGQLFGVSLSEYDETVYNPAAGHEFYILGSHLRNARATYVSIEGVDP